MQKHDLLIAALLFSLLTVGCKKEAAEPTNTPMPDMAREVSIAEPAEPIDAEPVTAEPVAIAPAAKTTESAIETLASTDFRVASVAISTAVLPPFPFFSVPDGLKAAISDEKNTINFDRHFFLAGKKMLLVEGRLYHNQMSLIGQDKQREYSTTEFHRNYENAVLQLGGVKISESQFTRAIVEEAGGLRETNQHWRSAPPTSGYEHHSYLIRTADKEYWIQVSTAAAKRTGYIVVLEKAVMTQSLSFLDASAMKSALDSAGRVALYINFDVDASTLREDSQAVIVEIKTLLDSNAELKLSIEGHTDNTGGIEHNRQLSSARAQSVLNALVQSGINPARLSSAGFGSEKPLVDNTDEAGRAKNRRVELVKR